MKIAHLQEGLRIYKRKRHVMKHGLKQYAGTAAEICKQIIEDCWNGTYFQTSTNAGHFCEFYMRDFGWAAKALVQLGHQDRVLQSLEYALAKFSVQGLTTTINPKGKCIDVFHYSPDSLAYLLYCLRQVDATGLVSKYRSFLEKEVHKCFHLCFDPQTSLIRSDRSFGSMKDSTNRYCSTYDNVMLQMISKDLDFFSLENPFRKFDIAKTLKQSHWNQEKGYWYDDIQKLDIVTGDNNTFPYWTGIFSDSNMIRSSIQNIRDAKLDVPFPLKYSAQTLGKEVKWRKAMVSDYQTHSLKTHMGAIYIQVVKEVDSDLALKYKTAYKSKIEEYGTYLENYAQDGTPIHSRFYYSDEGNLWAANYLLL